VKLVVVESPYAGEIEKNLTYVRAAMADCLRRGEFPFASHALYTQPGVLDDAIPAERKLGIAAGFAWGEKAELIIFYVDLGWSRGMTLGLERAGTRNAKIRTRTLGTPWSDAVPSDAEMDFAVKRAFCTNGIHLPYEVPVRVKSPGHCSDSVECGWHCPHCLNHVPLQEKDLRMLGPR
jgi:hypothetical protein